MPSVIAVDEDPFAFEPTPDDLAMAIGLRADPDTDRARPVVAVPETRKHAPGPVVARREPAPDRVSPRRGPAPECRKRRRLPIQRGVTETQSPHRVPRRAPVAHAGPSSAERAVGGGVDERARLVLTVAALAALFASLGVVGSDALWLVPLGGEVAHGHLPRSIAY